LCLECAETIANGSNNAGDVEMEPEKNYILDFDTSEEAKNYVHIEK
jgi:hypothetical protein